MEELQRVRSLQLKFIKIHDAHKRGTLVFELLISQLACTNGLFPSAPEREDVSILTT